MCWRVKAQPLHLVLLQVSLLLSLLSSFCCCTLSHRHPVRSYHYNYGDDYYSANNNVIIGEEDNEVTRNYYQRYNDNNDNNDNDDHDQPGLRNFMDDGMEQSEALAPSSSGYKIVSVDDYLGSNQDNADHNQVINNLILHFNLTIIKIYIHIYIYIYISLSCYNYFILLTLCIKGFCESMEGSLFYNRWSIPSAQEQGV